MIDNRAVSNTLGFVLLFAVVLASITAVATFGFDSLVAARDASVELNAEQSMQGLAEHIEGIRTDGSTLRSTLMRTGSGTLAYGDTTTINVWVDRTNVLTDRQFQPIRFEYQDTTIVYEAGAVIRVEGEGETLVQAPNIAVRSDTIIFPIMTTTAASSGSVSGGTVTTYLSRTRNEMVYSGSASNVTVVIETTPQRAAVWNDMLRERFGATCTRSSGATVNCEWTRTWSNVLVRNIGVTYEFVT